MDVVIKRGVKMAIEDLPHYSIALDGFVQGPRIDADHHRFSFDHHDGCYRYCTTSACMQAHTAILLGLDPSAYTIYANDVDADVCAAIWCLRNPDRCKEPMATKLINAIGSLDMHGGAFGGINGMGKAVEWISAPETDSRRNNDYHKLSDSGLYSILEAVLHRIDLYVDGEAQIEITKQPKHGEYKILRNENDWALVESQDPHAFASIYQAGFDRVVLVRNQTDGSLCVTLAKRSDFISGFPIKKMYEELNKAEGCDDKNGWGGGSTIGGAPRRSDGSRSKLKLEEIVAVIDKCVLDGPPKL